MLPKTLEFLGKSLQTCDLKNFLGDCRFASIREPGATWIFQPLYNFENLKDSMELLCPAAELNTKILMYLIVDYSRGKVIRGEN